MPKYALLKGDVVVNVVNAEADWVPPDGLTKEPFDKAIHRKPAPPEPTELRIKSFRFLFQLHTFEQRRVLQSVLKQASRMTDAESKSKDPTLRSADGAYPILALQVIDDAYEMMAQLGGTIDIKSPEMPLVMDAFTACGVYGFDPAVIASEVARVLRNEQPASA